MPNREKIQMLTEALDWVHDFRRRDLAEVWADVLEAATTDPEARAFIDRFGGDGDLLFGVARGRGESDG